MRIFACFRFVAFSPHSNFLHSLLENSTRTDALNDFIDWIFNVSNGDVWFVTGSQVIDFMRDPQPISAYAPPGCSSRDLEVAETCNGLDDNGDGSASMFGVLMNLGFSL